MRLLFALVAACLIAPAAHAQSPDKAANPPVVHLWSKGQPGFEARRDIPEQHAEWWWRSINNPSLTVFTPPAGKAGRAAVIVVPGGGHQNVVFGEEGIKPAQYLASQGVTAFALKYVLAREAGSPYSIEGDAQADVVRAVRWVRAHADEYNIDPNKVGVMGFSAGGELTSMVAFNPKPSDPNAADPVDRLPGRPDFLIEIYPGPLGIPPTVFSAPPPAFLLTAWDDKMGVADTAVIEQMYLAWPNVSLERHVLSGGQHGFNMGDRSKLKAVQDWKSRLGDWLIDQGLINR